jgi:hypothetical protein
VGFEAGIVRAIAGSLVFGRPLLLTISELAIHHTTLS